MFSYMFQLFMGLVQPAFLGLGSGAFSGQAKQLYNATNAAQGQYGTEATTAGAELNPFFSQEMKATHGYNPTQLNEMLTAAEGGAGAATGAERSTLMNDAVRTHNASGVTKSLDEMARDKSKAAAGASESIAAGDVNAAKQLNQAGAAGLSGMYNTDVGAQLKAMGLNNDAIKTEISAAEEGPSWLTGLNQATQAFGDLSKIGASIPTGQ